MMVGKSKISLRQCFLTKPSERVKNASTNAPIVEDSTGHPSPQHNNNTKSPFASTPAMKHPSNHALFRTSNQSTYPTQETSRDTNGFCLMGPSENTPFKQHRTPTHHEHPHSILKPIHTYIAPNSPRFKMTDGYESPELGMVSIFLRRSVFFASLTDSAHGKGGRTRRHNSHCLQGYSYSRIRHMGILLVQSSRLRWEMARIVGYMWRWRGRGA